MRDRLITSSSFQHGLTTLGFNLSEEVTRLILSGLENAKSGAFPSAICPCSLCGPAEVRRLLQMRCAWSRARPLWS